MQIWCSGRSGAHPGHYILGFIAEELERLGVRTFADLRRRDARADANLTPAQAYKLVVTATDVTRGRLLRLPWDYALPNLDPDEQLVADAVRASISIPLFFERWPTLGVKVIRDLPAGSRHVFPDRRCRCCHPRACSSRWSTAIIGHDQTYLERPCVRRRAIQVDTSGVGVVAFGADSSKREALVANGERAAQQFLAGWDWKRFKRDCRGVLAPPAAGGP